MEINLTLIGNMLIALFLYNILLKSIGATILNQFLKSDEAQKQRKTFRDRLRDKLKEEENNAI